MTIAFHAQVLVLKGFGCNGCFFANPGATLVVRPLRTLAQAGCTDLSTDDVDKDIFLMMSGSYAPFISKA
ncbi:hypothetical protein G7079_00505 [Thermomonas sp. HDW16]|nr:hypothetical protein G7079_00505 [Thermomonas sp. HDW16]